MDSCGSFVMKGLRPLRCVLCTRISFLVSMNFRLTRTPCPNVISDHEKLVGDIAAEEGFKSISLSSEISPRIKMLQRATAVCTDAYLSPIVHTYVEDFLSGFEVPPQRVEFMSSDGGLRPAQKYTGNAALLSGPAGGVVGVARSCYDLKDPKALIGFDMVQKSPLNRNIGNVKLI